MNTKQRDYIIVGLGLAGCVYAYQLLKRGILPLVYNNPTKAASSHAAGGIYNPFVFKFATKSWMADELIEYLEQFYPEMEAFFGAKFFYPTPIKKLMNAHELKLWKKKKKREDFKAFIDNVSEGEIKEEGINQMDGYVLLKHSGWVDIPTMIDAVKKYLKTEGLYFEEDFELKYLDSLSTDKKIVLCTGKYIDEFFTDLPYKHTKGETLNVSANFSSPYILYKNAFLLPKFEKTFTVGSTYDWDYKNETPTKEAEEVLKEKLNAFLNTEYTVVEQKAGIRATLADRRPILGEHTKHKNLFAFSGLGSKGVMLAPYFSEMLFKHIEEGAVLLQEIDVKRFY